MTFWDGTNQSIKSGLTAVVFVHAVNIATKRSSRIHKATGFERKGEPMDKQRIVRPIIKNRLIYIYNPDPIRFFFWHKPEGLLIANFRFRVSYCGCNSKNLNKLHILIRSPLFCIERNNGGTTIGNKYQLFFVKHRAKRRTDG